MTGTARLAHAAWLERPATRAVLSAIEAGGAEARVVGGAVRNALLGLPVKDIDIATTALPQEVMRLVAKAGLKAVPTGIEHGTVTVVSEHIPYEVTTLRQDVETFGRHAKVMFSTDWAEDARRRDFTINALYCDRRGVVHDPVGGLEDIARHRVRFIGDPRARIREDWLRILRFFRISAEYSEDFDEEGLRACAAERGGLAMLSAERVRAELLRLLVAPRAMAAVRAMHESGILDLLLNSSGKTTRLERLVGIEAALGRPGDAMLRLAALSVDTAEDAARLRDRLRLSNDEATRLEHAALSHAHEFDPKVDERPARILLYRLGPARYAYAALMAWARATDAVGDARRADRLGLPHRWQAPKMPFSGADVLRLGVPAGPDVGRILSTFEDWWIARDFPSDRVALQAELARIAGRK